jgi:hypothetical protein
VQSDTIWPFINIYICYLLYPKKKKNTYFERVEFIQETSKIFLQSNFAFSVKPKIPKLSEAVRLAIASNTKIMVDQ